MVQYKYFVIILLYISVSFTKVSADNVTEARSYLISLGISGETFDNYIEDLMNSEYRICQDEHVLSVDSLFLSRTIALTGPITPEKANVIQALLLYFDKLASDPITLLINSPGGSVYAGLGIYDTMNYISCDVHTKCVGMAASMACVILSSGEKGYRSASHSSCIMIHPPNINVTHLDDIIELGKVEQEIFTILAENTMKSYEIIKRDCTSDYWLSAEEAIDYGIVDEISY